jgi:hypothetical protein
MSTKNSNSAAVYSLDGLNPTANGSVLVQPYDGTFSTSSATFYSAPVSLLSTKTDYYRFVLTCPSTGAPVGNVKLQACIDATPSVSNISDSYLLNWIDLGFNNAGASQILWPISGATQIALDEWRVTYGWVRMVATLSSGTITPTVRFNLIGAQ